MLVNYIAPRPMLMAWGLSLVSVLSPTATIAQQAAPATQSQQGAVVWERMPRIQLEEQFAGPLKDTAIQRWRDPRENVLCYIYLPFTAPHTPATSAGYVLYGSNMIGSISCLAAPKAPTAAPPRRAPEPRAAAPEPKPR
jgi:hypothetical protein